MKIYPLGLLILLVIIGIGIGIQAEYQRMNRNPTVIRNVILSLLLSLVYIPMAHMMLEGNHKEYKFIILGAIALFGSIFTGLEAFRFCKTTKERFGRILMAIMLLLISVIVLL